MNIVIWDVQGSTPLFLIQIIIKTLKLLESTYPWLMNQIVKMPTKFGTVLKH